MGFSIDLGDYRQYPTGRHAHSGDQDRGISAYGSPEHIEPLWWCLSLGACLGNATLVGASANLTVAGIAERNGIAFRFVKYTAYALPMTIVSIVICHVYVWLRYF